MPEHEYKMCWFGCGLARAVCARRAVTVCAPKCILCPTSRSCPRFILRLSPLLLVTVRVSSRYYRGGNPGYARIDTR